MYAIGMEISEADPGFLLQGGAPHFCRIPVVFESRRSSQGGEEGSVYTPCTIPLGWPLNCMLESYAGNISVSQLTKLGAPIVCLFLVGGPNGRKESVTEAFHSGDCDKDRYLFF